MAELRHHRAASHRFRPVRFPFALAFSRLIGGVVHGQPRHGNEGCKSEPGHVCHIFPVSDFRNLHKQFLSDSSWFALAPSS